RRHRRSLGGAASAPARVATKAAATQARHGWMDASLCLHTTAGALRTRLVPSAPGANISQIMAFRRIPRQRPGCRGRAYLSSIPITCVAAGTFAQLGG